VFATRAIVAGLRSWREMAKKAASSPAVAFAARDDPLGASSARKKRHGPPGGLYEGVTVGRWRETATKAPLCGEKTVPKKRLTTVSFSYLSRVTRLTV